MTQEKDSLRREIRARRRGLSARERETRSAAVLRWLFTSGVVDGKPRVALYAAAAGEVLTRPIFARVRSEGGQAALPRVRGRGPEIDFFWVEDWDRLVNSRLGIPEPAATGEPAAAAEFDLAVVPGVAFDRAGHRLGFGMGCYDRFLTGVRPGAPRVGLGYDFQLVDQVPAEPHDVTLDLIVVERGIVLPDRPGVINHKLEKGERRWEPS